MPSAHIERDVLCYVSVSSDKEVGRNFHFGNMLKGRVCLGQQFVSKEKVNIIIVILPSGQADAMNDNE